MNARFFARALAVKCCSTRRATPPLAILLFAFSVAPPLATDAHEGEDHGSPEPVAVAASGETRMAASGAGSLFEGILKYRPFARGEAVAVTLYLVSAETNRPVVGATVGATLSEGDRSSAVAFAPKLGGPVGAYSATVTAETAAPMSWLFDVAAGEESDLIGVTGFQARAPESAASPGGAKRRGDPPSFFPPAPWVAVGALSVLIAFAAGRASARKSISP